jgi:hypothetical protein
MGMELNFVRIAILIAQTTVHQMSAKVAYRLQKQIAMFPDD